MAKLIDTLDYDVIDWLGCLGVPEYVAQIPAGHILTVAGVEYWIDGAGNKLSREKYIHTWKVDPKIVWEAIKLWQRKKKSSHKIVML